MKKANVVKKIFGKGCLLIIILTLGFRIGNAQIQYVNCFPKTYAVTLDSIQIPPVLLYENVMITTGNKLVSVSTKSDTIFRVFSLPDCKYLGAFGRNGNGPNEFNRLSLGSIRPSPNGFFVGDLKYFREIVLPEGDISDHTIEQRILKRNESSIFVLNQCIILNDSITLGILLHSSPKELAFFNHNEHEFDYDIDYPEDYKRVPDRVKPFFYVKHLSMSPDKTKLAYTYSNIPKVRIIDLEAKTIVCEKQLTFGPEQIKFEFTDNSYSMEGMFLYYFSISSTSDYFYAFYRLGQYAQSSGLKWLPSCELHKYNWKGDPIAKIPLPQWAKCLAIEDDDSKIYFLNQDIEDKIYFLDLKRNDINE